VTDRKEERGGDTKKAEDVGQSRKIGDPKGPPAKQKADIQRLREELMGECRRKDDRIAKLEQENAKLRGFSQEAMEAQARQARVMQEQLKQTEGLLQARTAQPSGAQAFLSTEDHLSEMEVLSIVHDLNRNIFQLAVSLTDAWEKLESSQATEVDPTPQPHVPVLIQLARKRDLTGLTFLLQSFLCSQAMDMTSSWAHNRELSILECVYQRLSASGKHHIINTKQYVTYVPQRGKQFQPDGGR